MVLAQMGDGNQVTWKPGQAATGNLLGRRARWTARLARIPWSRLGRA